MAPSTIACSQYDVHCIAKWSNPNDRTGSWTMLVAGACFVILFSVVSAFICTCCLNKSKTNEQAKKREDGQAKTEEEKGSSEISTMENQQDAAIKNLNKFIQPFDEKKTYDALLESIGDAEVVLIGEASHGTHEFYQSRAEITKRLIKEKGFTVIGIEGDWPNAYQVHRYVQGRAKNDTDLEELLRCHFKRFPTWMWANTVVVDFAQWLKEYNRSLPAGGGGGKPVSFYGLDFYSLYTSVSAVVEYLGTVDKAAAEAARKRYSCLNSGRFDEDDERVAQVSDSCRKNLTKQLIDLQQHAHELLQKDGPVAEDEYFSAVQNAKLIKNAEAYYRSQLEGDVSSWNLRDTHMFETLLSMKEFKENQSHQTTKVVVWAHNSHLGNAKATDMSKYGEINIGQLVKEHFGPRSYNIGYTTYSGTVTAAPNWGGLAERKAVKPGMTGSYEHLFHQLKSPNFMLVFKDNPELCRTINDKLLERAIGVVYRPQTERRSHYFYANLPKQFDAVLHFDETHALESLATVSKMPKGELPDTYPSGV